MKNQFTTKNQSVDKVFTIIEYMSDMRTPLKLLELSKGIGFPSSTTLRLLTSLMDRGYVYQDQETLKYSLTLKFCRIGDSVKSSLNITEIVHSYLLDISNKTGQTAYFAIEQDMMLVYLDTIKGNGFQTITTKRIGHVAPLHAAGIGKLLLLNYSESQLMKLIHSKGLPRFTDNTLCTYESLKIELEKISKQGYAMDDQECEEGIRCIAVPIKDYSGTIIGGISISGSTDQILPEKYESFLDILISASEAISEKLGYKI